jgi:murein DD-endopeptidase MepM/ murein hydrolase activator NlpD
MFKGSGEQPEDWLGFGATIAAPGDGTVVEVATDATDHGPSKVDWDKVPGNLKLLWGNYVLIDHGHGVVSGLFHLKQNSVSVKIGDAVKRGQPIAQMGFSGDAFTVHTHYQLQQGPAFDTDGLPSRFSGYKRVIGSKVVPVAAGSIDTGDVVEP